VLGNGLGNAGKHEGSVVELRRAYDRGRRVTRDTQATSENDRARHADGERARAAREMRSPMAGTAASAIRGARAADASVPAFGVVSTFGQVIGQLECE